MIFLKYCRGFLALSQECLTSNFGVSIRRSLYPEGVGLQSPGSPRVPALRDSRRTLGSRRPISFTPKVYHTEKT